MPTAAPQSLNLRTAGAHAWPDVDRERGVIQRCAVITAGPTKPSGGGQGAMVVDAMTLQQVAAAINATPAGVKVRQTHTEIEHPGADDLPHRVGHVVNARVAGNIVLADVQLHGPKTDTAARLMDMAERDPEGLGLSIHTTNFSMDGPRLRVHGLDAVDFVGDPAANRRGLIAASARGTTMPTITQTDSDTRRVQDALLVALGAPLIEHDERGNAVLDDDGRPIPRRASREVMSLASGKLADIGEHYLRCVGSPALRSDLSSLAPVQRVALMTGRARLTNYFDGIPPTNAVYLGGHSTGDFPSLLADTLNKAVIAHFATTRRSWRAWAKQGSIADFKPATRVRIDDAPELEWTAPGDEVVYKRIAEPGVETMELATYTRGVKFTRAALLNDDTEGLRQTLAELAAAAHRLEDRLAYGVLTNNANLGDGTPLFHTNHANLATGTLTAANLDAAAALIAKRTTTGGEPLDWSPAVLLVPAGLKRQAEKVLAELADAPRWSGERSMVVVSSPRLDADSSAQFYLFTDPAETPAVEVAFLRDHDAPRIESKIDFDTDGMKWKVTHDVVAFAIDHRAVVRSSGA